MIRSAAWVLRGLLERRARRFANDLDNPEAAQQRVLEDVATRLAATHYGRSLGVESIAQYRERVPVVDYNAMRPWIERQKAIEEAVVVPDRVLFYEKTSGSSGPAKYIPYTAALKRSFTNMFAVWAHDLIAHGPRFSTGKLFFSVSPSFDTEVQTDRGVPVGLEDDGEYLEGWLRWFMAPFFVAPKGLSSIRDPEAFKERVCATLLAQERLEIISVWNPTFLKIHLDWMVEHRDHLATRLRKRRVAPLFEGVPSYEALWPHLKLVSCWDSAHAARPAGHLRHLFPHALVQGKGLLATEAPMTVPLIGGGCAPMLDEVFFEFEDAQGELHLLHEVEQGQTYAVVLSQKGGLYRYRMGDLVRVEGRVGQSPSLAFVGRDGATSDLVGEKLHEAFVREAIDTIGVEEAFVCTLVPVREPDDHYVLLLDQSGQDPDGLAVALDAALMQSHHYRHARLLGQLAPARVQVRADMPQRLVDYHTARGIKWGDIKDRALMTTPATAELLEVLS